MCNVVYSLCYIISFACLLPFLQIQLDRNTKRATKVLFVTRKGC